MKKVLSFMVLVVLCGAYGNLFANQELVEKFCKFMRGEIVRGEQTVPYSGDLACYGDKLPFTRDLKVYEKNSSGRFYEVNPTLAVFVSRIEESRNYGTLAYTFGKAEECEGGVTIQGSISDGKGLNLVVCYKLYFEKGQRIHKIERSVLVQKSNNAS